MVLALEGDSTMTSLVPPLLLTFEAVPVFAFAVAFLAGTLFPSCNLRVDRLPDPMVTRRPSAVTAGPVRCVPSGSPDRGQILPPQVESPANLSTIGPMA